MSKVVLTAAIAAVGIPLITGSTNVAAASPIVNCSTGVTIFGASTNDTMWVNVHNNPTTGTTGFTGYGAINGGWSGRVLAGRDNQVFWLPDNGELRRSTWNGTTFSTHQVLESNRWYGWSVASNRNRITVDSNNHIYAVLANGTLEVNVYNETTGAMSVRQIAADWGKYDLIFASGNGVIYARDPLVDGGKLYRFQYDYTNNRWTGFNRAIVGGGWNVHRQVFSPGGEIIYGVTGDSGQLYSYRYDNQANSWIFGPSLLGSGWGTIRDASATTNTCTAVPLLDPVITCQPNAVMFGVGSGDNMWVNEHTAPEWAIQDVWGRGLKGSGWAGRTLAGKGGNVYWLPGNGELRRWVWNGNEFTAFKVFTQGPAGNWDAADTRNRITVDAQDRFFSVQANGNLEVRTYDETTNLPTVRVLDTGWSRFDLIAAAGDGVVYARDASINGGTLFRYHYDAATNRWLEYGKQLAGGGWNIHRQVFSPGADVLYGIHATSGELYEYRYNAVSGEWTNGGTVVSYNWHDLRNVSATTDGCSLRSPVTVALPTVPLLAPNSERPTMVHNSAMGRMEWAFVSNDGVLVSGRQSQLDPEHLLDAAVGEAGLLTGGASIAIDGNGHARALGHVRTNADFRAFTKTPSGTGEVWGADPPLRGAFASGPVAVRGGNGLITAFAVDAEGQLWTTAERGTGTDLKAWRKADSATPYTMTTDFSVVASGTAFQVAYRTPSNAVAVRKLTGNTLQAARTTSDVSAAGIPGLVVYSDDKVRIATRTTDGKLHTQKETALGFGAWQDISGGESMKGSPSVLLNKWGIFEIVVRTSSDSLLRKGETAPSSGDWRSWEDYVETTSFDPVQVARTNTSGAAQDEHRILFRDGSGNLRLMQVTAFNSDPAASASLAGAPAKKRATAKTISGAAGK